MAIESADDLQDCTDALNELVQQWRSLEATKDALPGADVQPFDIVTAGGSTITFDPSTSEEDNAVLTAAWNAMNARQGAIVASLKAKFSEGNDFVQAL